MLNLLSGFDKFSQKRPLHGIKDIDPGGSFQQKKPSDKKVRLFSADGLLA